MTASFQPARVFDFHGKTGGFSRRDAVQHLVEAATPAVAERRRLYRRAVQIGLSLLRSEVVHRLFGFDHRKTEHGFVCMLAVIRSGRECHTRWAETAHPMRRRPQRRHEAFRGITRGHQRAKKAGIPGGEGGHNGDRAATVGEEMRQAVRHNRLRKHHAPDVISPTGQPLSG